jgi:alpha-glucosidase (family GH31 glycosyl hydrolase)
MTGDTVVRPLFHEYPLDNNTYGIDQQFMWGSSILLSPFLFEVSLRTQSKSRTHKSLIY